MNANIGPLITAAGLGVASIMLSVFSVYQISSHRRNLDIESKRHYYPLDFEKSSKYIIVGDAKNGFLIKKVRDKRSVDRFTISAAYGNNINLNNSRPDSPSSVIDDDTEFVLRKKVNSVPNWWSQDWLLMKRNETRPVNFISSIHLNKSHIKVWKKDTVYFPLRNRFSSLVGSSHITPSAGTLSQSLGGYVDQEFELESAHYSINDDLGSPFTNINTASDTTAPHGSSLQPYVDPSLHYNQFVSRADLGETEQVFDDVELFHFEKRKLFKLTCHSHNRSHNTRFRLARNSMEYKWNTNGYLEKNSKDKLYVSTERIGFYFIDETKHKVILYVNEDRIEQYSALLTFFVHYLTNESH